MKTHWEAVDVTVYDYLNGIESGRYKIDPEWQRLSFRHNEWKSGIIAHFWEWSDLNPLYFHRIPKDATFIYECLDGRQRSEAIKDFIAGRFRLCGKQNGLRADLCNKMFSEWPVDEQLSFKELKLRVLMMPRQLGQDEISRFFQDRQHSSDTKTGEQIGANPGKLCYKWLDEAMKRPDSPISLIIEKLWGKDERKSHLMVVATCLYIHVQRTDVRNPTPETLLEMWNSDGIKRHEFDEVMKLMNITFSFMSKNKVNRQRDQGVFCAFFKLFSRGVSSEILAKLAGSTDPKLSDLMFSSYSDSPHYCCHKQKSIDYRYKFLLSLAE